MTRADVKLYLL